MNQATPTTQDMSRDGPVDSLVGGQGAGWRSVQALLRSRTLAALASLAMVAVAIWVIHAELRVHPWSQIVGAFGDIPASAIAAGVVLTVGSFLALAFNERFALGLVGQRRRFASVAASTTATYAVTNSVGFSFATAAAVRMRFYGAWGLDPKYVAGVSALTGLLVPLGAATAAGLCALATASELASAYRLPVWLVAAIALAALLPALIWLRATHLTPTSSKVVSIAGVDITRPGLWRGALGLAPACADWLCAAGVLYALLPDHGGHSFPAFVAVFVCAGILGAVSGAPGGIGIFEATILALTPAGQSPHDVAAALVLYRVIYTLAPLAVVASATGLTLGAKLLSRPETRAAGGAAQALAPGAFSILTFAAGALLLLSGATPGLEDRLRDLHGWIPLPVTEFSHLFGSVVGVLLLFVAAGLWRRFDAAYYATLVLLLSGAAFSIFKGFDVEEAVVLSVLALLLWPCHAAFPRRTPLSREMISWPWLAAAAGVVGAVAWIGLIAYRHVDYNDEMWWTFLRDGEIQRSLRGTAASLLMVAVVGIAALLRPARTKAGVATLDEMARAEAAIAKADQPLTDAWLAMAGDKHLLFSDSGESFIMYGRRAGHWIAMSEPVGRKSERRALIYRFRELADLNSAQTAFYSVTADALPDMIETGHVVRKIGETAIVSLEKFGIEGKARASLRHARNRAAKEGFVFEVLPAGDPAIRWDRLKAVSDAWLQHHHGAEKRYSLGRFDIEYLRRFPVALFRAGADVVSFANVWATPDKRQLSVDLMRYDPTHPHAGMDALFIELMLWGKAQGYREFDLGMAPLAGLESHRMAPILSRLGAWVFKGGERFYGFRGLKAFKDKFDPDWRPMFLACAPGLLTPVALADVALLTSGGWQSVLT